MDVGATADFTSAEEYLKGRWKDQCEYFERKAALNQKRYMETRLVTLFSSWLTPIAIFVLVVIHALHFNPNWAVYWDVVPLVLSTIAIGSYQWEDLHNYGAQWAKFRLIAEKLKGASRAVHATDRDLPQPR